MAQWLTFHLPQAENGTRAHGNRAYGPAASTRIPALACSWWYFTVAAIDSSLGIFPASESLLDFRISMNFIFILLNEFPWSAKLTSRPHFYVEPRTPKSTSTGEFPQEIHPAP